MAVRSNSDGQFDYCACGRCGTMLLRRWPAGMVALVALVVRRRLGCSERVSLAGVTLIHLWSQWRSDAAAGAGCRYLARLLRLDFPVADA